MQTLSPAMSIRTTNGSIALLNLNAQVDGLELHAARGRLTGRSWMELVDLLVLRAQITGCIADYERTIAIAEQRVRDAPADPTTFLSRARAWGCLHRFDESLADLDAAERLGAAGRDLAPERAAIFQAVGRYDEAMVLRRAAFEQRADFETCAGLASLHAELGETAAAEELFEESQALFRGVSPFPLAQLEFQRGHMWHEHGDLARAREWYTAAWRRLPAFAHAEGHLAEVEAAMGERDGAIARLQRLAAASDDPDYAAQLANILGDAGRIEDAHVWRVRAEERYDALVAKHPAAFADHASEFWASAGGNPERAIALAKLNLEIRRTPRAHALFSRAIAACAGRPKRINVDSPVH
ncbi:tetratricopeptide repeat protein [Mesorhizobium sp. ORM16]|uniref:tetratricopeptide repeat protein n=1 Tax=Mesorhizobium sp. ORM16 TaxID=3376989 RepID=UPI003857E31D